MTTKNKFLATATSITSEEAQATEARLAAEVLDAKPVFVSNSFHSTYEQAGDWDLRNSSLEELARRVFAANAKLQEAIKMGYKDYYLLHLAREVARMGLELAQKVTL